MAPEPSEDGYWRPTSAHPSAQTLPPIRAYPNAREFDPSETGIVAGGAEFPLIGRYELPKYHVWVNEYALPTGGSVLSIGDVALPAPLIAMNAEEEDPLNGTGANGIGVALPLELDPAGVLAQKTAYSSSGRSPSQDESAAECTDDPAPCAPEPGEPCGGTATGQTASVDIGCIVVARAASSSGGTIFGSGCLVIRKDIYWRGCWVGYEQGDSDPNYWYVAIESTGNGHGNRYTERLDRGRLAHKYLDSNGKANSRYRYVAQAPGADREAGSTCGDISLSVDYVIQAGTTIALCPQRIDVYTDSSYFFRSEWQGKVADTDVETGAITVGRFPENRNAIFNFIVSARHRW